MSFRQLRTAAALGSAALFLAGCAFQGVNSLALPGALGRGADALSYRVEVSNVGALEPNSPVMIDDVAVGSVRAISVEDWHAVVDVSLEPDTVVPENVAATVGQTSLLGSMHLALDPPLGLLPQGRLQPGSVIPLSRTTTYPSTERTLSTLSAVANSGGLGQVGDIIHGLNEALDGRQGDARQLLTRLDVFVGIFDGQRGDMIAALQAMSRLAGRLAAQRDVVTRALNEIPPALDVLIQERPRFTTALNDMRTFSDTAVAVVNDTQRDLVDNLTHLAPTVGALADVGPDLTAALAFLLVLPFGQNLIDRGIRGDYMNLYATMDLTIPRLKRTLLSGTRFGDSHAILVPAPGDPGYGTYYGNNPLTAPLSPAPPESPPGSPDAEPPLEPPPTPIPPMGS